MGRYAKRWKRVIDIALGSFLAVLTAPVQAACAIAIKLDDGGPVLFRQERSGRGGVPFEILKFRTMRPDTEKVAGGYPSAAMVTHVGAVLRRTSLDEVPQLYNIIRGDMSFVGPRPALTEQATRYTEFQRRRLQVRPGLTGMAQLRYRNTAPWSQRIKADVEYVERLNLLLDLRLMLMTIPKVVLGSNQTVGQSVTEVDDLAREPSP
jgi:lipopolysaccharide/colanic/teichoic acid biosynthesis glycosyltransferase